jgi:hypothetical protein
MFQLLPRNPWANPETNGPQYSRTMMSPLQSLLLGKMLDLNESTMVLPE